MRTFRPYIRKYNYIQDYFNTIYDMYLMHYKAFPVNYYSLDFDNSVLDNDMLIAGSYEKLNVGELSGVKWKKIFMVPVSGLEQFQPSADSGELGVQFKDSMTTTMLILEDILTPKIGDFIDINFGLQQQGTFTKALFTITNYELGHHGDKLKLYKCSLKISNIQLVELEQQISAYYQFYEPLKKVYPLPNASLMTKLISRTIPITENLNNLFNKNINFYYTES